MEVTAGENRVFRAGAARVDIMPPENAGIRLWGYNARTQPFTAMHDRIYWRAVVIDDGRQQAAILSGDMALVSNSLWRKVTARIEKELRIPPANVLMCATHTHSGAEESYCDSDAVASKAVEAVERAQGRLEPARIGVGKGHCNINVNRRARTATGDAKGGWWLGQNPDGPSDKTVHVVRFDALDGKPIAVLINYAAHGTTMGKENLLLSGDHPGACSRFVESHYGGPTVALWTSGAAADQDPIYAYQANFGGRLNPVVALGRILGEEVVRVGDAIKTSPPGRIRALQKVVRAPGQRNTSGMAFRPDGSYQFVDAPPVEIRLSALAIDKIVLCGISGEVFSLIGQRLKKLSPCPDTILLTHANGSSGYLPNDDAYDQISYEIMVADVKRGVEKILLDGMTELLKDVAGDEGPVQLRSDDPRLDWWRKARLGMFVHWGPVTLKEAEIGWSRGKEIPVAVYDNLYKEFNPVKFDAREFVALAKESGAKYMTLVAKHMDGFAMFATKLSDYNITHTPFGRDITRELADECRRQGLRFCLYYSIIDQHHPDYLPRGPGDQRPTDGADFERYYAYMKGQVRELLENYHPSALWFDGEWEGRWTHRHGLDLYRFCRSIDPEVLINDRVDLGRQGLKCGDGKRPEDIDPAVFDAAIYKFFRTPRPPGLYAGDFATPEQCVGGFDREHPWETCMTIGSHWSWRPAERLKSTAELVRVLVACAGGDGNLLINVGPRADGRIDPSQAERVRGLGAWLARYGESIYGTRGGPWKPGPYGVSTCLGSRVFVHVLDPHLAELRLPQLPLRVTACTKYGGEALVFHIADGCLVIPLPATPDGEAIRTIGVTLDGDAAAIAEAR